MTHSWWQTGVIYQVYPRNFLDSNGDGERPGSPRTATGLERQDEPRTQSRLPAHAGFTDPGGRPWLPLAPDYQVCNVESEQRDPLSVLALVHTLLERRRAAPALSIGS